MLTIAHITPKKTNNERVRELMEIFITNDLIRQRKRVEQLKLKRRIKIMGQSKPFAK
jgi:hypothetical protein